MTDSHHCSPVEASDFADGVTGSSGKLFLHLIISVMFKVTPIVSCLKSLL